MLQRSENGGAILSEPIGGTPDCFLEAGKELTSRVLEGTKIVSVVSTHDVVCAYLFGKRSRKAVENHVPGRNVGRRESLERTVRFHISNLFQIRDFDNPMLDDIGCESD